MADPNRSETRRRRSAAAAAVIALAFSTAACDLDAVSGTSTGADAGVFYGLGDDHHLYRWDPDADNGSATGDGTVSGAVDSVLDLSGVWDQEGDVGTVLRASLSIDPRQRYAAWVEGASPEASLKIGDLETGAIETAAAYPVDHACIDPAWLADGSAVLVHRAAVWGNGTDPAAEGDATPLPIEVWGPTEWYSPEAGALPTTVDLEPEGCRLRWYTAEDGTAQAIYHNPDVTELYRIDASGQVLETIPVASLQGSHPLTIGLVGVDPSGRYACVVDGYGPEGAFKGGFTMRAEAGTRVLDLENGEAVGAEDTGCVSLHEDGYVSRDGAEVAFIGYDGAQQWPTELPDQIAESPVLFFAPNES